MLARRFALVLLVVFFAACSDGGSKQAATPTPTPSPPTEAEVKAAFLTAEEVGEGFTAGSEPKKESVNADGKDPKALCGVELPRSDMQYRVLFTHESGTTQVFEQIQVMKPGQAEKLIAGRRSQAQARCEYDESVGETKYHVKVEGPIPDLPRFGDEATGTEITYTGGYKGRRYAVAARIAMVVVYMEYTAPDLDEQVALDTFTKAIQKARALAA